MLASIALTVPAISHAQVAGSTIISVAVTEMRDVTMGRPRGPGGYLGLAKHDVAVPVSQLKLVDNKLILEDATKDSLKASPPFEYAS